MAMAAENVEKPKVVNRVIIDWICSQTYFTVPEIADKLQVNKMTIYRAIDRGELEVLPIFPKKATQEQLAAWLKVIIPGINDE